MDLEDLIHYHIHCDRNLKWIALNASAPRLTIRVLELHRVGVMTTRNQEFLDINLKSKLRESVFLIRTYNWRGIEQKQSYMKV